jgi:hypothetical protein
MGQNKRVNIARKASFYSRDNRKNVRTPHKPDQPTPTENEVDALIQRLATTRSDPEGFLTLIERNKVIVSEHEKRSVTAHYRAIAKTYAVFRELQQRPADQAAAARLELSRGILRKPKSDLALVYVFMMGAGSSDAERKRRSRDLLVLQGAQEHGQTAGELYRALKAKRGGLENLAKSFSGQRSRSRAQSPRRAVSAAQRSPKQVEEQPPHFSGGRAGSLAAMDDRLQPLPGAVS